MDFTLRAPHVADGAEIERLAATCDNLDRYACYLYLLLCRDFPTSCAVARHDNKLVGFLTGYFRPSEPSCLFVWQVAVAAEARGCGLAQLLLWSVLRRPENNHVTHLEATVTPENLPSRKLFQRIAAALQTEAVWESCFQPHDFGSAQHEPEDLVRVGPFSPASVPPAS